jgi:hypothetical protein
VALTDCSPDEISIEKINALLGDAGQREGAHIVRSTMHEVSGKTTL